MIVSIFGNLSDPHCYCGRQFLSPLRIFSLRLIAWGQSTFFYQPFTKHLASNRVLQSMRDLGQGLRGLLASLNDRRSVMTPLMAGPWGAESRSTSPRLQPTEPLVVSKSARAGRSPGRQSRLCGLAGQLEDRALGVHHQGSCPLYALNADV